MCMCVLIPSLQWHMGSRSWRNCCLCERAKELSWQIHSDHWKEWHGHKVLVKGVVFVLCCWSKVEVFTAQSYKSHLCTSLHVQKFSNALIICCQFLWVYFLQLRRPTKIWTQWNFCVYSIYWKTMQPVNLECHMHKAVTLLKTLCLIAIRLLLI